MEVNALSASKSEPLVSFRDADIVNGESTVIYGLDMDIFPGDFIYIVGKVGTGKTSIIRTMIGENPLEKGCGEVCGFKLNGLKDKDIPYLRRRIGVVFQDFQLLMDRTVESNLEFVLKATGWKDRNEIDKRILEVLAEQQRIAIARSLLNRPKLIIADEPTGNLDNETADGILRLLTGINKEDGTAIVMVTHNRTIFEKYPGRVFVCKDEKCKENLNDEVIDLALTI